MVIQSLSLSTTTSKIMPTITKCPPGEAIGYRDDDPRLTKAARHYIDLAKQDLSYMEDLKREEALNIHKSIEELQN